MTTKTFTVNGVAFRTRTRSRYVVVRTRAAAIYVIRSAYSMATEDGREIESGRTDVTTDANEAREMREHFESIGGEVESSTYVAFAEIERRTDSVETARRVARRIEREGGRGVYAVIVDTETGEAIDEYVR